MKTWQKRLLYALVLVLALGGALAWVGASRGLELALWGQRKALELGGFETALVDTSVGPQFVFRGGDGFDSTVVLVHGFGDQAASWAATAEKLANRHRVILPDLAGHGASEPSGDQLRFDDVYRAFETVMGELHHPSAGPSLTLVGNSLGGWLTLRYALDHPENVERLVLVNAAGMEHTVEREYLIPTTRDALAVKLERMFPPDALPTLPGFAQDQLIAMGSLPRLNALFDSLEASHWLDERLGDLAVPAELIWGTPDGFFPLTYAQRLAQQLPKARLRELPACGHAPQIACPDRFSAVLSQLLEEPVPRPETNGESPAATENADDTNSAILTSDSTKEEQ